MNVNADHPVLPEVVRKISPESPLFLMRSRTWDPIKYPGNVRGIIPSGLERVIIVDDLDLASEKVIERAKKYQELGVDFVVWNNRCQVSLATLEYVFQTFSHCLGTAEGEHFSGMYWEKGPEGNLAECDFVHRAWTLCAKYGRFYFFADGDGGGYRWPGFAERVKETLERYRRNIVPMFKATNGDMALHSYGAVQGLMASGYVDNCGTWVDEWIWNWPRENTKSSIRDLVVNITCPHKPGWQIEPSSAAKEARWDEQSKTLSLCVSHRQGAVEVTVNENSSEPSNVIGW